MMLFWSKRGTIVCVGVWLVLAIFLVYWMHLGGYLIFFTKTFLDILSIFSMMVEVGKVCLATLDCYHELFSGSIRSL